MADKKIIIELKGDSLPKEKPQGGSGGGQGSGGGGPDSPGSRKAERRGGGKPPEIHGPPRPGKEIPQRGFDFQGKRIPTTGSMDDVDGKKSSNKPEPGTVGYERRRKYLLNKRRKATRRREARWAKADEREVNRLDREVEKQQNTERREQESYESRRRRILSRRRKAQRRRAARTEKLEQTKIARGTKMQNIAAGAGRQFAVVAGGGRFGAAVGAAQTAAKFLGPLAGPVGIAVAGIATAFAGAAFAAKSLDSAIMDAVDSFKDFSGPVSRANAEREMVNLMMQIRRAQTIGPQTAEYIRGRTTVEAQLADIKTAILYQLIPVGNALLPAVSSFIQSMGGIIEDLENYPWEEMAEAVGLYIKAQGKGIGLLNDIKESALGIPQIMDAIEYFRGEKEKEKVDNISDQYQRKLTQFLQLTVPERIFGMLETDDDKRYAPGAIKNVPLAQPFNPLGGP